MESQETENSETSQTKSCWEMELVMFKERFTSAEKTYFCPETQRVTQELQEIKHKKRFSRGFREKQQLKT